MRDHEERFFLIFVVVVSLATIWIALPFSGAILWGLVAAIMFDPLHRRLNAWWPGRKGRAALVTLLAVIGIVIIPAGLIGSLVVDEALSTYSRIQSRQIDFGNALGDIRAALPQSVGDDRCRLGGEPVG